jgi:hypothetical protein
MSNCKQLYYQTLAFEMKVVLPSLSHCCKDPRYYSSLFSPLALLFQAKHPLQKYIYIYSFKSWVGKKLKDIFTKLNIHMVPSSGARSPASASSLIAPMQSIIIISICKINVILKISETVATMFFLYK